MPSPEQAAKEPDTKNILAVKMRDHMMKVKKKMEERKNSDQAKIQAAATDVKVQESFSPSKDKKIMMMPPSHSVKLE